MSIQKGGDYNPGFSQQHYDEPRRGWLGRNCIWLIPVGLLLLASPFVCLGGAGFFLFKAIAAPVDAAVAACEADDRVTSAIGSPITKADTGFQLSNYHVENDQGNATLPTFSIRGPKGKATLSGEMLMRNGTWFADKLTVVLPDGSEVEISNGPE